MLERVADVRSRGENTQIDRPAVRGPVVARKRVGWLTARGWHPVADYLAALDELIDRGAGCPPSRAHQRHVELQRFPGAFTMEQGRSDSTGDVHTADRVSEGSDALRERTLE